jgi:glucan phosphoethanolaminetransferase (alkaline phosphatase superfamily)
MTENNITKPWYKKRWGLVIAILLFPYFLLWYMWFKSKRNTTIKIAVSVLCCFFIIISLVAIANPNPQTKTANKVAPTSTKKTVGPTESSATKKTTNPPKTIASTAQPVVSTADLITEPQAGIAPFISAISGASKSVDLVMYQL